MEAWTFAIQALIAAILGLILSSQMRIRERITALETMLTAVQETYKRHSDWIKGIDDDHGNAIRALEKDVVALNAFMKRVDRQEAGR